jgi:peptidoglycan/LPS O-acetylase OafA/YrhL
MPDRRPSWSRVWVGERAAWQRVAVVRDAGRRPARRVASPAPAGAPASIGAPPTERFPCFDGLRGLAALSVLVFHVGELVPVHGHLAHAVLDRLDQGVSVFFVISGFLLFRPFLAAHVAGRDAPDTAGFARRRALRIYPAYWCALLVSVYVLDQGVLVGVRGKIQHLALVQTYFAWPHGTALTPAWTLVVEITFYAMLPLYVALVRWAARATGRAPLAVQAAGALTLLAAGTVVQLVYAAHPGIPVWMRILPLYLPMFAWGMLLAVVSVWLTTRAEAPQPVAWLGRHPAVGWAFGAASFAVLVKVLWVTPPLALHRHQVAALYVLGGLIGLGFVLPAALGPQREGWIRAALRSRPVAFLGTVSYAFYLWHLPLLTKLDAHFTYQHVGGFVTLLVLGVALSLAVATVSWYAIERPAIALSRRRRP